ncbi:hypothetical protein FACS1894174_01080 [Bacteroidia bacterium]|nr:hypothetical protein FACS1894174_01080 [Bacteroidia bacterium]
MKKLTAVIALCIVTHGVIFSQINGEKYAAFQFGFVTPLSTNGFYASQYTNGVSINVLLGVSKNETEFTLGSFANIITNNANGLQIAGLCNFVGNGGKGVLISGLSNLGGNNYKGGQLAGLLNRSENITGFQLAGLGNRARNVAGVQIAGLINVAKHVSGIQLAGIVNIAEDSDCPVGLINLIKNGEKGIGVTYNETGSTVVSFRSGGKITYGIVGMGYNHKTKGNSLVIEGGMGVHIDLTSWFGINQEIKHEMIGISSKEKDMTWKSGYSLLPTFRIAPHFEIFGGLGINYLHTRNIANAELFPSHSLWKKHGTSKLQQVYIGYQIGVQYVF